MLFKMVFFFPRGTVNIIKNACIGKLTLHVFIFCIIREKGCTYKLAPCYVSFSSPRDWKCLIAYWSSVLGDVIVFMIKLHYSSAIESCIFFYQK